MQGRIPKKQRGKIPKRGNASLIRAFVENLDFGENYEIWEPYIYRGMVGFADLVVDRNKRAFLFEFLPEIKEMERAVKNTKLKAKIFKEKRGSTKTIDSYMVLKDEKKNRRVVVQNDPMLENQPFGILFFDGKESVSYSGTKSRVPRLFQTRNVELEPSGLAYLIEKPNHEKIEEAILNLDDLPETIDRKFVEQVERYVQIEGVPSEGTSSLELKRTRELEEKGSPDVYVEKRRK